ncbi:uterine plasmin/trypsin inhibitor-like [Dermacentor albipictus]|uniref:uterine plasmin/trypsin inhibitor-like n=1 Tax=Dermacentor albipictus TaxID=60249 RepID=UPI0038FD1571
MRAPWVWWISSLLISCSALAGAAPASQEWRLRYAALATRDPESCRLEPERGLCYAAFTLYYFDAAAGTCEEFLYGGCGGNANRFGSLEECLATCASAIAAAGKAQKAAQPANHRSGGDAPSPSAASHANGAAGLEEQATRSRTTPTPSTPEAENRRVGPASMHEAATFISSDLLGPLDGDQVWDAARL